MNFMIVSIDLVLVVASLLIIIFEMTRRRSTSGWLGLLSSLAYWVGGIAAGHLFILLGLKPTLGAADAGLIASTIYYLCCAFWGGLLVHLWDKLDGR